jgi:hypothetical protein
MEDVDRKGRQRIMIAPGVWRRRGRVNRLDLPNHDWRPSPGTIAGRARTPWESQRKEAFLGFLDQLAKTSSSKEKS